MKATPLPATVDWWQLKLRLRPELRLTSRESNGNRVWIVEDPWRGKFYELGDAEQTLLAALDGTRTLAEAHASLPVNVLDASSPPVIARWLVEHELVQVLGATGQPLLLTADKSSSPRARFNPLMCELITFNPGPWLASIRGCQRWIWSWPSAALWAVIVIAALAKLAQHFPDWIGAPTQVLDPSNWLRLALVWAALKVIHEWGHALASERYGAPVTRAGLKLMMFAPVAFVDVTASCRLANRWQRIVIAAAGMIVELLVASLAVLLWTPGSSRLVDRLCVDLALLAGGHTLLFNLNPLMRFDGYFMLADLLGITNLAAEGSRHVTRLRRHWFGGVELPPLDESPRRARGLLLYGLLATLWRGTMLLAMVVGLIASWDHWGIVASGVLVWFWFGGTALLQQPGTLAGRPTRRARRRQVFATVAVGLGVIALGGWLASPARVTSPAVVEYAPLTLLRADAAGFVDSVAVKPGDTVAVGQTLVVIRNDELTREWQQLNAQREQTAIQARLHLQQHELVQQQSLLAKLTALDEQLAELDRQRDALTVRATAAGMVVTRDLAALTGRYVKQGDVLLAIGDATQKELIVSVAAEDEAEYVAATARAVHVYRPASLGPTGVGRLTQLEPRARDELPHEALGANTGGPVVVRPVLNSPEENAQSFKSLEPRLIAKVSLTGELSQKLWAGERVTVAFGACEQSWARRWLDACARYLHQLAHRESIVAP